MSGEVLELAESLCAAAVARVLRHLGPLPPDGSLPEAVTPRAQGAYGALVRFAVARGLLRAGSLTPRAALLAHAPYAEQLVTRAEVVAADPVAFRWLCRALDHLEDVLRGAVLAEAALFPEGDFTLAGQVYADSPLFGWFGTKALQLLPTLGDAPRVLELGAGTGSTAQAVIEQGLVASYLFTDVSDVLVAQAQARIRHRAVTFRVLDVDADDALPGPVDGVMALNVLHLSRDPEAVLDRIRRALVPGGFVLLGEVCGPEPGAAFPLMELTFGLLPSLWRHAGPAGPLRPVQAWSAMLTERGFGDVQVHPAPHRIGGVIVARRTS
ncbi:MAG: class I SAM-dependent methyltransferase [Myxococcales bacterium]|nr:class I SAM-dependent methyltransferase [Myxococcales bacterium]